MLRKYFDLKDWPIDVHKGCCAEKGYDFGTREISMENLKVVGFTDAMPLTRHLSLRINLSRFGLNLYNIKNP